MAFSLAVLSLTASVKIAALRPVSLYPGWELDAPLQLGEDLAENGDTCGASPQEARDRGCKFDLVLYLWVPTPCYDEEIQIAYRKRESEWYRNRGGVGGEIIPQDRAALGIEERMWLSWDYHDYHCIEVLKGIDPRPSDGHKHPCLAKLLYVLLAELTGGIVAARSQAIRCSAIITVVRTRAHLLNSSQPEASFLVSKALILSFSAKKIKTTSLIIRRMRHKAMGLQGIYARVGALAGSRV
jgi:hypothetical protein